LQLNECGLIGIAFDNSIDFPITLFLPKTFFLLHCISLMKSKITNIFPTVELERREKGSTKDSNLKVSNTLHKRKLF